MQNKEVDTISSARIREFWGENASEIYVFDTLESTSITAKQLALDGASNGCTVIANKQTAGRGRMGRSFFSPPDSGIYMSVVLRPKFPIEDGVLITTLASVAVCHAIENVVGVFLKIKWVNDLLLNGKKICGILAEAVTNPENGSLEFVILGIGVNFVEVQVPEELKEIVGFLQGEKSGSVTRERLIAEILKQIFYNIENFGGKSIIEEYKKRSVVLGKSIEIHRHDGKVTHALAVDIDDRGGLVVRLRDGTEQTLNTGEISIRGDFYDN